MTRWLWRVAVILSSLLTFLAPSFMLWLVFTVVLLAVWMIAPRGTFPWDK